MSQSVKGATETLRAALAVDVAYTCGVQPIKAEDLCVYYKLKTGPHGDEKNARSINLDGEVSEEELEQLVAACDPAPFGLDDKDVLDEKVRKAGQIDVENFVARLDVSAAGIIDAIIPEILSGEKSNRVLRAEMYKLNVYGRGCFFKPHQDTPRAQNMIGSLVIFFPTAHKGGELVLTHGEDKFTFDSAAELGKHKSGPAVAYIAFYSDTKHEVLPVHSGHRVTLTFNLFVDHAESGALVLPHGVPTPVEREFESGLVSMLADQTFLPEGGFLGFGLAYTYPMPTLGEYQLPPMLHLLKGSDARIRTVATRLGLPVRAKIVYDAGWWGDENTTVLMDHPVNAEWHVEDMDERDVAQITGEGVTILEEPLHSRGKQPGSDSDPGAKTVHEEAHLSREETDSDSDSGSDSGAGAKTVHWVTPANKMMRISTPSGSYFGNHGGVNYIYGNVALFVEVPAVGDGVRAKYL
ncbi:hypothetical protein GGX14DRAFT_442819 [Mycena pura]|uniref:Fe2OG dioxygenase domain-containing protein n=1 Tax=Mycena pura TaxID=153505 RepID=A0AAD6VK41_9AGAR|nr:hypothetical protein GGX14DRAFT_442819 [Mycena pura]